VWSSSEDLKALQPPSVAADRDEIDSALVLDPLAGSG
jgi:hypothetical protein